MSDGGYECTDVVLLLNAYFGDIIFNLVKEQSNLKTFVACIASGLGGGYKRYAIAHVPSEKVHLTKTRLSSLPWKSFQTRTLYQSYKLPQQQWKMNPKLGDIILRNVSRSTESSTYVPEVCLSSGSANPFEVTLLHDPKKKTQYQFHNRIRLSAAVETFQFLFVRNDIPVTPSQHTISTSTDPWYHSTVPDDVEVDGSFELL